MKPAALVALSIVYGASHNTLAYAQSDAPPDGSRSPSQSSEATPTQTQSATEAQPASEATAPRPPAPYSVPWQLRPAMPATVVRSDTALAFYDDAASHNGSTVATTLLASYKVTPEIAPLVRVGFVRNSPPAGDSSSSFVNPIVGGVYGIKLRPELRLGLFLGAAIPVGQGGGNTPDLSHAAATKSGIYARSAMDNAMFAVNDFVLFPGADLAWVDGGLTVQAEVTVLQLMRVRGADVQPDSSKTNFTTGIHVGYFLVSALSIGAELRHQRWLSTPAAVEKDAALRDTTTFAIGPRAHLQLDRSVWFRPGIAYARGLDAPMTTAHYNVVQVDLILAF